MPENNPEPPAVTPPHAFNLDLFEQQMAELGLNNQPPLPPPPNQPATGPAPLLAHDEPKLPIAYYDHYPKFYWTPNTHGGWVQMNELSLSRKLKSAGFSAKCAPDEMLSPLAQAIMDIQVTHDVVYAGPLAGYPAGLHEICGNRILVTQSPTLIEPAPGDWPLLSSLLEEQFIDGDTDQRVYLLGWLKYAVTTLRAQKQSPGQALVITGERDAAKSLLQNLITMVLGGRAAKPFDFMTGRTPFNADLFYAEHLMIEDEAASTDIRTRRTFGALLKNVTVNETQSCHTKFRTPVMLRPFWRLTITMNDEPENLMVLPPMDESIKDKIILLRARKPSRTLKTESYEKRQVFWDRLIAELPHFLDFVLSYEVPKALQSTRFGVTHYHHPEILDAIDDSAPEERLLNLIDEIVFGPSAVDEGAWSGTAQELERELLDDDRRVHEIRKLLYYPTACGVYLSRLEHRHPERVSARRIQGQRRITINPPRQVRDLDTEDATPFDDSLGVDAANGPTPPMVEP